MVENILYYSDKCPDTEAFVSILKEKGIKYRDINITESMYNLKKFLLLRDQRAEFQHIKEKGHVGIPVLLKNKQVIFDVEEV